MCKLLCLNTYVTYKNSTKLCLFFEKINHSVYFFKIVGLLSQKSGFLGLFNSLVHCIIRYSSLGIRYSVWFKKLRKVEKS